MDKEYIGIDVSKGSLNVAEHTTGKRWQVSNDESGIRRLVKELGKALTKIQI